MRRKGGEADGDGGEDEARAVFIVMKLVSQRILVITD